MDDVPELEGGRERPVGSGVMGAHPLFTSGAQCMKISRLQPQTFKIFDTVDIELGDLNVFIGANAFGKSNVLRVMSFLRPFCPLSRMWTWITSQERLFS